MFCALGLVFDGTADAGFYFLVPMASSLIFKFCAPVPVFDNSEGVGSSFHVLRSRTRFRQYQECRVQFSCSALPDPFLAIPRALSLVFIFCAPGLIFGGTKGARSSFNVWRSRTHFRRYQGRRVEFSCFSLPKSFSAVLRASDPIFMFCASKLVFGGTEDNRSSFHVLRSRTRFRRYRWRRIQFSCFVLQDSLSAVPRVLDPVFMFCAPRLIFSDIEGVKSSFHVLRSRTRFQ
jgi:hypothetical protein